MESKTWLKQRLESSITVHKEKSSLVLLVSGKHVCNAAFKLLYGLSNNKFAAAQKDSVIPHSIPVHGNINNNNRSNFTAKQHVFNWIQDFVEECGDVHPTESTIYVPKYIAKTALYSAYKSSWEADNQPVNSLPSSSMFYTVLETKFAHVKFLKKTLLRRCDFCMSIPLKKKAITNEEETLAFKAACKAHYQLHSGE